MSNLMAEILCLGGLILIGLVYIGFQSNNVEIILYAIPAAIGAMIGAGVAALFGNEGLLFPLIILGIALGIAVPIYFLHGP